MKLYVLFCTFRRRIWIWMFTNYFAWYGHLAYDIWIKMHIVYRYACRMLCASLNYDINFTFPCSHSFRIFIHSFMYFVVFFLFCHGQNKHVFIIINITTVMFARMCDLYMARNLFKWSENVAQIQIFWLMSSNTHVHAIIQTIIPNGILLAKITISQTAATTLLAWCMAKHQVSNAILCAKMKRCLPFSYASYIIKSPFAFTTDEKYMLQY